MSGGSARPMKGPGDLSGRERAEPRTRGSFTGSLPALFAASADFATSDRSKAARNLRNAEVFIVENLSLSLVHPIYWLLHVRGKGAFSDNKRSNQNLDRFRPELSRLGYVEISDGDVGFEQAWEALKVACDRLGTTPSRRTDRPDWSDRRFFVVATSIGGCDVASPDEIDNISEHEGAAQQVTTNRYERSLTLRNKCIAHYRAKDRDRLICQVCNFDFEDQFGDVGAGFIHIHHLDPLGNRQVEHLVNPVTDLIPLCPNCHAMAHRGRATKEAARSPEELRQMLGAA